MNTNVHSLLIVHSRIWCIIHWSWTKFFGAWVEHRSLWIAYGCFCFDLFFSRNDHSDSMYWSINVSVCVFVWQLVLKKDFANHPIGARVGFNDFPQTICCTNIVFVSDQADVSNFDIAMTLEPFVAGNQRWKYAFVPLGPPSSNQLLYELIPPVHVSRVDKRASHDVAGTSSEEEVIQSTLFHHIKAALN